MSETMSYDNTPSKPNPDMGMLDKLVGTWHVSGGTQGQIRYEWMDGGFFLMQHIDMESDGRKIKGVEIIGHMQQFGEEPSVDIKSRYYGNNGETFDYVYEMQGDTLIIWGGEKGSPAYYKGMFNADSSVMTGAWVYPDGGGYNSVMRRIT